MPLEFIIYQNNAKEKMRILERADTIVWTMFLKCKFKTLSYIFWALATNTITLLTHSFELQVILTN